jgi:hypothetical protein
MTIQQTKVGSFSCMFMSALTAVMPDAERKSIAVRWVRGFCIAPNAVGMAR